jgi:hypothetical protein
MKLAWICYPEYDDEDVVIKFEQPESWRHYRRVVQIVYSEIDE